MNLQRRVRQYNNLLRSELGINPEYAWIYSESMDFLHPMLHTRDDGSPVYDYHAQPTTGLIVALPEIKMRKINPRRENVYVLCIRKFPDMLEWLAAFGSVYNYPRAGKWIPVDHTKIDAATGRVQAAGDIFSKEPSATQTQEFIRMVRESRDVQDCNVINDMEFNERKREKKILENYRDAFKEDLGVSSEPGKMRERSFAAPGNSRKVLPDVWTPPPEVFQPIVLAKR